MEVIFISVGKLWTTVSHGLNPNSVSHYLHVNPIIKYVIIGEK